jgi:hypothetical protein
MTGASRQFSCCARAVLAFALLALAGCASTPQAAPDHDAEAKQFLAHPNATAIYVFRSDFSSGDPELADTVLYIDQRLIGATLPKTYFRVDVRPGTHVLHGIGYDSGSLKIDTRYGELYFVSLDVIGGKSRFALVSAEAGKRTIGACCALLENWAPGQRPLLR